MILRAIALPAPIRIIEERIVGPKLVDSIKQGTQYITNEYSSNIYFLYYKLSGLIANFALIWNIL